MVELGKPSRAATEVLPSISTTRKHASFTKNVPLALFAGLNKMEMQIVSLSRIGLVMCIT